MLQLPVWSPALWYGSQEGGGGMIAVRPSGTSGLPGLWNLYQEGNLGSHEAWGYSQAARSQPPRISCEAALSYGEGG